MIRKLIKVVFLGAFLLSGLSVVTPNAYALKESLLHQVDHTPGSQVNAHGEQPDATKGFVDNYGPPQDFTTWGHRIDWLFQYTSWVASIFFVIMAGALGYFSWAYRARPGHKAYYTHGKSKGNTMVTRLLDLAVFITLDSVMLCSSYMDAKDFIMKYPQGDDVVKVMVMPQQWMWNFRYPGADGKFDSPDSVTTINDLRIPRGKKVLFQLKSKDVVHGFMVPYARMQVDAMPGSLTRIWFDANKDGDYEIACYHHCGTSHYKMKAFLKVMEPEDYEAWLKENREWAKAKYDPEDKALQWGWDWGI